MHKRFFYNYIIGFSSFLFYSCNSEPSSKTPPLKVTDIKKQSQQIVDSVIGEISKRNNPYKFADSLVRFDNSSNTLLKLDSLIRLYPNNDKLYLCRGYWHFKNKNYENALYEYHMADSIARFEYPVLLDMQALVYIEINEFDMAIQKYKVASSINELYYYPLANAFERSNKIDSAIYYYALYFQNNTLYTINQKKHYDSLLKRIRI